MLSAQTQASGNGLSRSSTTLARTSRLSWLSASSQIVLWSMSHQALATRRYQHNEGQGPAENRESVGASVRYGHTMAQARVLRRCAEALAYCPTILLATERALWLPPAQTTLPPEIA